MTAPDAAEKLAKIKAIVDAWQADDVPDQDWQHHFDKLEDIADILSDKPTPSPAKPEPADEFEADVRAVVEELLNGPEGIFKAARDGEEPPLSVDAAVAGAMADRQLVDDAATLVRNGAANVGNVANVCILALVGRRMAAREAAKGGR